MVMDLRKIVSRLRKENQSLTNAFFWLCSGNADWQTLVSSLPKKLCEQLPSKVPLLLTSAQPASHSDNACSAIDGREPGDAVNATPIAPEPPLTPGLPGRSEASQRRNSGIYHKRMARPKSSSRPGSARPASRQAEKPHVHCSDAHAGLTAHRYLEQFPELAALENEFQDLVCRPGTA
jgi:hypothetical protein